MADPQEEDGLDAAQYLAADALASELLGMQDQLFTGAVSLQSIDADGRLIFLFGGVVAAQTGALIGSEAIVALLSGPPAKVTIARDFELPTPDAMRAHSIVLSDIIDRWRLTNKPSPANLDLGVLDSDGVDLGQDAGERGSTGPLEPHPAQLDGMVRSPFEDLEAGADIEDLASLAPRRRAFGPADDRDTDNDGALLLGLAFLEDYAHSIVAGPSDGSATPAESGLGGPTAQPGLPPVLTTPEPLFLPVPAGQVSGDGLVPCPKTFASGEDVRVWVERERFTGLLSFGAPETLRLYIVGGRVLGVEALTAGTLSLGVAAAHAGANAMAGRPVIALHYERDLSLALAALASDAACASGESRPMLRCQGVACASVCEANPDQMAIVVLTAGDARMLSWRTLGAEWRSAAAGGGVIAGIDDLQAAWVFTNATFAVQYLDPATLRPLFVSQLPA